ncbi:hypothetical protein AVEN_150033-1 [Araneus ventricosus]|uniref:Uncharacterized protein n=1 Tax=Araneus ventricosus TaxID=182803 RepID=A0A4Y2M5N2_ARAVE|nr:hypothetical protein AVEN_38689-1 [Araneus ventricosus]GBN20987.1 hypothetical protein AVEN_68376-1 [Araneus ventricosus]GBN21045.1 hypothetical protein AVEN_150033-1 [Araneus ventricosus]
MIIALQKTTFFDQNRVDRIEQHVEARKIAPSQVEDCEGNMDLLSPCLFPMACKYSKIIQDKKSENQASNFLASSRRKVSRKLNFDLPVEEIKIQNRFSGVTIEEIKLNEKPTQERQPETNVNTNFIPPINAEICPSLSRHPQRNREKILNYGQ